MFAKKLMALFEVRKMMAIGITGLFIALALLGTLEVNFVQTVIISVISFYFGKTSTVDEKGAK